MTQLFLLIFTAALAAAFFLIACLALAGCLWHALSPSAEDPACNPALDLPATLSPSDLRDAAAADHVAQTAGSAVPQAAGLPPQSPFQRFDPLGRYQP